MLYDSDPRLWGYFIEGSDGHLNENANNERMVSNGTPVKFHSVTLGIEEGEAGDDAAADMATDEARLNAAGAGDEIILNSPPYSVNVSLVLAEGTTAKEYDDVSLVPGGAVLPTLCKHKSKKMSCLIPGFAVVVVTTISHGTDLATAMTFYRAPEYIVRGCLRLPLSGEVRRARQDHPPSSRLQLGPHRRFASSGQLYCLPQRVHARRLVVQKQSERGTGYDQAREGLGSTRSQGNK